VGPFVPAEEDVRAWGEMMDRLGSETSLLALFYAANLSARIVEGLPLEEGITEETSRWVEAWTGQSGLGSAYPREKHSTT